MDVATRLQRAVGAVYQAGSHAIDSRWQAACDPALPQIADYLRVHARRLDRTLEILEGLEHPHGATQAVDLGTWPPYRAIMEQALSPLRLVAVGAEESLDLEADRLPFDDGTTAVVLLLEVLEHFYQDPLFALREIHRILQPGGHLVLSTPNLASFRSIVASLAHFSPMIYGKYTPGNLPHVHEFVPREVRILLDAAGFEARVWTQNAYHRETPVEILDWLRSTGFSPYEREDTIFAVATKAGSPGERYPVDLYDGVPPARTLRRTFAPIARAVEPEVAVELPVRPEPAHRRLRAPRLPDEGEARLEAFFDRESYAVAAGIAPEDDVVGHYLSRGAAAGLDPHPLFSSSHYHALHPDVVRAGINPLEHYARAGGAERRAFHPLFDSARYVARAESEGHSVRNPLLHFLRIGVHRRWSPHPLVDLNFILDGDLSLPASGRNPLVECIRRGRSPHPFIDVEHVLRQRPGFANAAIGVAFEGTKHGLSPHPLFDSARYLEANPDLARAGVDPLLHYLDAGAREGRSPHPLFDPEYYVRQCGGDPEAARDALRHFLAIGARRGLSPHPLFDPRHYWRELERHGIETDNPLVHFLSGPPLCDPSATFDVRAYASRQVPEVVAGMNPLLHFVLLGSRT